MTKDEFIKVYADLIANGRKINHPDIRRSEEAVSRVGDEKRAAKVWMKHRVHLRTQTEELFIAEMAAAGAVKKGE